MLILGLKFEIAGLPSTKFLIFSCIVLQNNKLKLGLLLLIIRNM